MIYESDIHYITLLGSVIYCALGKLTKVDVISFYSSIVDHD
jgi:hypothetical protein